MCAEDNVEYMDVSIEVLRAQIAISSQMPPNKAFTGRWGFCANLKQFSTPQPFSARTGFVRPPQRQ